MDRRFHRSSTKDGLKETKLSVSSLKGHGPDYAHAHTTPPTTPRKPSLWLHVSFHRVNPGHLPNVMRPLLGHMHTYRSASLKQNTDLAYYCSTQLVEIAIQGYKIDEGQVSDIGRHASKPACASRSVCLLK